MAGFFRSLTKHLLGISMMMPLAMDVHASVAGQACPGTSPAPHPVEILTEQGPDYGAINRVLLLTDDAQRRTALRHLLSELSTAAFAEKSALADRLRIALAHTDIRLGNTAAAVTSLKTISLDSSQAPEALVLLATATQQQDPASATPWVWHAAELFPHSPTSVEGLLLAAGWQRDHADALPLLTHARFLADQQFAAVTALIEQSVHVDFLESLSLTAPDPLLWSLTRTALTDPAFSEAQNRHAQARAFSRCLQQHLEKSRLLREQHPALLQDLGVTLEQLRTLLPAGRVAMTEKEAAFLQSAQAFKHCRQSGHDCHDLSLQRDQQGRELTRLRNSLRTMEQQQTFLAAEQQRLLQRWQKEQQQMTRIGRQLMQQNAENRAIMAELLQAALARSRAQWQELSARAHYELARTQEALLHTQARTGVHPSRM